MMKHALCSLLLTIPLFACAVDTESGDDASSDNDEIKAAESEEEEEKVASTSDALQGGCSNAQIRYAQQQCRIHLCKGRGSNGIHSCRPNRTNGINVVCACKR